jgi:nucleoside-diphosphate-sugar epimerase
MIVIFGASTDIGTRLAERLSRRELATRLVSRTVPGSLRADLSTGEGVDEALRGATTVVSCAHARFTAELVGKIPRSVTSTILVGSTWRYSKVPNKAADEVRAAEAIFLASRLNGIMLHPTMIYGGRQENNVPRLLELIRRSPIVPVPGGGNQIVQPIHIEDLVDCLDAAVSAEWKGPNVLAVGGPPVTWRKMASICADTIGKRRLIVNVPLRPVGVMFALLNKMGLRGFDPGIIWRFEEDTNVSMAELFRVLGVSPRDFDSGLKSAVAEWGADCNASGDISTREDEH